MKHSLVEITASLTQLKVELLYEQLPWISYLVVGYSLSFFLLIVVCLKPLKNLKRLALAILWASFSLHTLLLLARIYILQRPPVSNMFETLVYVPWVTLAAALFLTFWIRTPLLPLAASGAAALFALMMQLSSFSSSMEPLSPVLNSRLWLMLHVLMVSGSYGFFLLASALSHLILLRFSKKESIALLKKSLLHCLYIGVCLLLTGTILGGVWAAQSWGRFWDWDPKESWAFISLCLYLIQIHAYHFGYLSTYGLALGAIVGFASITFTWYGVNFLLGAGLHTYGFGHGGTLFYLSFLSLEALFLFCTRKQRFRLTEK